MSYSWRRSAHPAFTGWPTPTPICSPGWRWTISTVRRCESGRVISICCNAVQMGHFRFQCQALGACVLWPSIREEGGEGRSSVSSGCSCKPWQVANKVVRPSASPVFTSAPQLVIIEKRSSLAKVLPTFQRSQPSALFTPFVFPATIGIELGTTN